MDDDASPEPIVGAPVPAEPGGEGAPVTRHERRLRRLAGRKAAYRGPILAVTRGWVSRDRRLHLLAARFLDFAMLTPEHLVLCSTGFFTRRPRRQVFREPLTRLLVTPQGPEPVRVLRIVGDFSHAIRLELRADPESLAFARALLEHTPDRRAAESAAAAELMTAAGPAPPGTPPVVDAEPPGEHTSTP